MIVSLFVCIQRFLEQNNCILLGVTQKFKLFAIFHNFTLSKHSWLTVFMHKIDYASSTLPQVHTSDRPIKPVIRTLISGCVTLRFTSLTTSAHTYVCMYACTQIFIFWYLRVRVCVVNTPVSKLQFGS